MPLDLVTIPCLSDNYAFLIRDPSAGTTALIDAPEAAPILAALADNGWTLDQILLTHHHDDHIGAVPELVAATGATVIGAAADAHRLPPLDHALAPGDIWQVGNHTADILDVSGHTIGHIAFHFARDQIVFTADSLMALGCGRLFEGTPELMWQSLSQFLTLPPETTVCSGHEYTAANARFALTVDPDNPALQARVAQITIARSQDIPTVPSTLGDERATNPFLRAADPAIRAHLDMRDATDAAVFAEIRARKDRF